MRDGEGVVPVVQQGERFGIEPAVQRLVSGSVQVGHQPLQVDRLLPGQPQRIFVAQYLFAFLVDEALRDFPLVDGFAYGFELGLGPQRIEHDVVAGLDGQQGGTAEDRCPFHLEGIGEDKPLELQRIAQQVVGDGP